MSDKQKDTQHIKLYAGPEHACGYLEEQNSVSVFADPTIEFDNTIYSALSRLGFRRSGNHVYRPQCPSCNACWAYRVLVSQLKLSKSHRRILKANLELKIKLAPPEATAEDYELYEKYISFRHQDGDMFPPSFEQYDDFLFSKWCDMILLKAYDPSGKTQAIMALDILDDGLSAVYSFFNPESHYKSLGTYLILQSIMLCQRQQLPYCYLGYYVENCNKMSYKRNFKPAEAFINNRWELLD
ncbi:arginyltransferase [Kangiella sp. HZ709]|uniref:arginyltransferase n=1 Tax=Kangiella sp. HZ709 TaxID=2666328 RepID=UPI0012AF5D4F|nr:arginyltransferase [Kangiella sp. HZ709]MRX26701.1 arginyltransferase [Kangiella sp. HZ709]